MTSRSTPKHGLQLVAQTQDESPRLALIGFRYDENSSSMKGAADAPPQIRAALRSESWNLTSESGVDLGAENTFFDAGDIESVPGSEMPSLIEQSILTLLQDGFAPISLGGDHSITYPIIRAFSRKYPVLNILHFDAHPDIYDDFRGNRYSHASPFARIMEEKLASRLLQVGIRTVNAHQQKQIQRFGVEVIEARKLAGRKRLAFDSPVYISFDIDALDPAFAPGVSHREPGGLSTRDAIDLIQEIEGRVIGADIVEFNPRMDPLHVTGTVCAKLLKEIAAKMLA